MRSSPELPLLRLNSPHAHRSFRNRGAEKDSINELRRYWQGGYNPDFTQKILRVEKRRKAGLAEVHGDKLDKKRAS